MKIFFKLFFLFIFNSSSSLYNTMIYHQSLNIVNFSTKIDYKFNYLINNKKLYIAKNMNKDKFYLYTGLKESLFNIDKPQYLNNVKKRIKQSAGLFNSLKESYWNQILLVSSQDSYNNRVMNFIRILSNENDFKFKQHWNQQLIHDLQTGRLNFTLSSFKLSKQYTHVRQLNIDYSNNIYLWKKGLNFPMPERLNLIRRSARTINWPNYKNMAIIKSLESSTILIPVNSLYSMIFAVPEVDLKKNLIDKLFFSYFDMFIWKKDLLSTPFKQGFFFFHLDDIKEMLAFSKFYYPRASNRYGPLQTYPIKMDLAYKWSRISRPRLHFKFIPSVDEIGNLLYKYKYYPNITFHQHQILSENEFQGVPIYTIKPQLIKYQNKDFLFDYSELLDPLKYKKQIIFTSLDSLYKAWDYFRLNNPKFNLPREPKITVYNLESYIKDCENNFVDSCKDFRVVPSEHTIKLLKNNFNSNSNFIQSIYSYKIIPIIKKVILWSKYTLWASTTRRKPDW
uniref:Uncharacterized protein n=1 Tax=Compsopogon caeruleus TaxID=31354 RepID=A0A1Z1XAW3_9RHOD|nr:hypothetical protein [Compsopogon caeruleus]ARX96001.1 hypothetical protein [Compsopogon caeruleus]